MTIQWDAPWYSGANGRWFWTVSRNPVSDIPHLVTGHFKRHCVCEATYESAGITPRPADAAKGWVAVGDMMCIPSVRRRMDIFIDYSGEWLIFETLPQPIEGFERFVNFGGFRLGDPREIAASFHPTWERAGLDWLYPIQERFWQQIERVSPVAYIGRGDFEVVVSSDQSFIEKYNAAADEGAAGR